LSFDEHELRLKVNQERASRVIAVSCTSTRPDKAAVVNRMVQLYVEDQSEEKLAHASRDQRTAKPPSSSVSSHFGSWYSA
jgi:uncharacterized protein involved in exopolysaccharide biosynthesis